jgi:hypothetical protein
LSEFAGGETIGNDVVAKLVTCQQRITIFFNAADNLHMSNANVKIMAAAQINFFM